MATSTGTGRGAPAPPSAFSEWRAGLRSPRRASSHIAGLSCAASPRAKARKASSDSGDDAVKTRRQGRPALLLTNGVDRRRVFGEQSGEGGLAGRHFVDHGAQREEVGACIDGLAACSGNMQATVPRVDPGEVRSPLGAPNVLRRMLPGWRTWPWLRRNPALRRRPPAWPNRNRGF